MCDDLNGIKFCTCDSDSIQFREEEYPSDGSKEDQSESIPLIYIWELSRWIPQKSNSLVLGLYRLPQEDIGHGLNAHWIVEQLNERNCFDFDYHPREGDELRISQNVRMGPYIAFIYKNDRWVVDHHNPLQEKTIKFSDGKVEQPG